MDKASDLNAWKIFVLLSRFRSFTEVAEREQIEVSTVSRILRKLETTVGHPLLKKGSRPLVLTDAGEKALPIAKDMLDLHQKLLDGLREDNRNLSGTVRLSVSAGFASTKLPFFLTRFNEIYPKINFELDSGKGLDDLKKNEYDIVIHSGLPSAEGVICLYRGVNYYLPLASRKYLEQNGSIDHPGELNQHRLYLYSGPTRNLTTCLIKGKESKAIHGKQEIRIPNILAIRNAVESGLGVAVDLPLNSCAQDIMNNELIPILKGWYRPPLPVYTVISKSSWMLKRVRIFARWFNEETFQDNQAEVETVKKFLKNRYNLELPAVPWDETRGALDRSY